MIDEGGGIAAGEVLEGRRLADGLFHVPPGIRDSGFSYATGGGEAVPSCLGTAETPPNDAAFCMRGRHPCCSLPGNSQRDQGMSRCRSVVDESMSWTTPWKKEKKQRGGAVLGDEGVFGDCRPLTLPFAIGQTQKGGTGGKKRHSKACSNARRHPRPFSPRKLRGIHPRRRHAQWNPLDRQPNLGQPTFCPSPSPYLSSLGL